MCCIPVQRSHDSASVRPFNTVVVKGGGRTLQTATPREATGHQQHSLDRKTTGLGADELCSGEDGELGELGNFVEARNEAWTRGVFYLVIKTPSKCNEIVTVTSNSRISRNHNISQNV